LHYSSTYSGFPDSRRVIIWLMSRGQEFG